MYQSLYWEIYLQYFEVAQRQQIIFIDNSIWKVTSFSKLYMYASRELSIDVKKVPMNPM